MSVGMNEREVAWFPASETQRARWFQYRMDPAGRGNQNNVFVAALGIRLDAERLALAVDAMTRRHPMLRARFRTGEDGLPEQTIAAAESDLLRTYDVTASDDETLRERVAEDAWHAFGDDDVLVRAHLYTRAGRESVFLLAIDHLVCDGWSYWHLLEQLGESLAGLGEPALDDGYRAYVDWQREWLASAGAAKQLAYWKTTLGPSLPLLQLPFDRPRPRRSTGRQGVHSLHLDAATTAELRLLSTRHAASTFTTLLAAFQILLHRYSGQETVVVGSPMPCRSRPAWTGVVGDFVNMVALRADFDVDPTVGDVLSAARSALMRGMRNQDYPFPRLVDELGLPVSGTENPVFQAGFVFQKARRGTELGELWNESRQGETIAYWGDVSVRAFPIQQRVANDRLSIVLHAIEFSEHLRCDFTFDADVFDDGTIGRLGESFALILRGMAAGDSEKASAIPIMPAEERQRVVAGFNDTSVAHDGPLLIHHWFESRVATAPDAIALRCGTRSVTYAELEAWANRIGHRLIEMGVCVEDRVAVHVGRGPELVAGILGILKAGAAYVPLDPNYPKERLALVMADCMARVCLVTAATGLPEGAESVVACVIDDLATAGESDARIDADARGLRSTSLAYVIYTSGSTGRPKGVMIEHANASNLIAWALRQDDADVLKETLFATSICFDLAVFEMFVPLAAGFTVHVLADVLAADSDLTVTLLNTVPSGITALLEAGRVPRTARRINLAGEPLQAALVERLLASTAAESVGNLYGPTETTTYSTAVRITRDMPFPPHIGKPIDNTRIYILDGAGDPVPVGVPGEIWIAGAGVARGYLGRPELTAERFGDDPFVPGGRAYRTGDMGRWLPGGDIVYLGRNDHQVKVRGFRIEPGEVEAVLLRCMGVSSAAVIAWGEHVDSRRLVAYVVPAAGHSLSQASLREEIAAQLPAYMVPSVFVQLTALPLTPNGKLDRAGLPPPSFTAVEAVYRAPEGAVEEALAEIWGELLGVDRVGRDDHFFESGGHSLLAMQLLPRLRRTFQVDVPLAEMFEVPILRVIAERIVAAQLETFLSTEVESMRDELDDLSEEQLLELLNRESVDD